MPDEWETKKGLNPKNAADRKNVAADGYTMLEKYINSIE
jgi:pectate lyase